MKNRVLRSALAVILVIAMVLTMAACGGDSSVDTTETPKTSAPATDKPVAPTDAPASVAPTAPPAVKDTVADDFGITLEAVDGVYGTKIDDVADAFAYFKLAIDESKLNKEDYKITITDAGSGDIIIIVDEDGKVGIRNGDTDPVPAATPISNAVIDLYDSYEGGADDTKLQDVRIFNADAPATGFADSTVFDGSKSEYFIVLETAGEYNLELEVLIEDESAEFGAWDREETEEIETTLSARATVAKKQVEIAPDAMAVKADEEKVLNLTSDFKVTVGGETKSLAFANLGSFLDGEDPTDYTGYNLKYSVYAKEAKEGTYAVTVELVEGEDEADLSDLNDALINNEITGVVDTSVHALSEYDWNEVLDVLTTIGEIDYDTASSDSTEFAVDGGNYKTQTELAIERYNSLSAEQQAFFQTGTLAQIDDVAVSGQAKVVVAGVHAWADSADEYYNGAASETTLNGKAFVEYMEAAEDAVKDAVIVDAFVEVVKDAKLADYFVVDGAKLEIGTGPFIDASADPIYVKYNTNNASAISAYNTVKSYFDGLSEDDQKVVEASGTYDETNAEDGTSAYDAFAAATNEFEVVEINAVKELIVGAYAAYAKAVETAKVVYKETDGTTGAKITAWAYIDSNEVRSLTAQAKAAYDELSDAQKDVLKTIESGDETFKTTYPSSGDAYLVVADETTYEQIITKLDDMNAMVDTMVKISNYVNIEDFSADEKTYDRLNDLVYGKLVSSTMQGLFNGSTYINTRFAMDDIIKATDRNYEAIITEYTAWIDFVISLEDVKDDAVESFKAGVLDGLDDMKEDLGAAKYDVYSAFDAGNAEAIVNAIKGELDVTAVADADGVTPQNIVVDFSGIFFDDDYLDSAETIDEYAEIVEEYTSAIEDAIEQYLDYVNTKTA